MEEKKVSIKKRYVDVMVLFRYSGEKIPKLIYWDDNIRFQIDKILDVRPAASRKAGGQGERYLCRINGTDHVLFFEDPAWFVEEKVFS